MTGAMTSPMDVVLWSIITDKVTVLYPQEGWVAERCVYNENPLSELDLNELFFIVASV